MGAEVMAVSRGRKWPLALPVLSDRERSFPEGGVRRCRSARSTTHQTELSRRIVRHASGPCRTAPGCSSRPRPRCSRKRYGISSGSVCRRTNKRELASEACCCSFLCRSAEPVHVWPFPCEAARPCRPVPASRDPVSPGSCEPGWSVPLHRLSPRSPRRPGTVWRSLRGVRLAPPLTGLTPNTSISTW